MVGVSSLVVVVSGMGFGGEGGGRMQRVDKGRILIVWEEMLGFCRRIDPQLCRLTGLMPRSSGGKEP